MVWNCIIVDDDEIDRLSVLSCAKRSGKLNVIGVFPSAEAAFAVTRKYPVDIMFLDIDMPGISGMDLRKEVAHVPVCIFITAHPEHAVETFELDTLDFIVKPLKYDRFSKTMLRVEEYMELRQKASLFEATIGGDVIYIKEGHEQTKVKLHDVLYLEALKDYTKIVTAGKRHCVLSTLGALMKEDHFGSFVRVHRSYAVQKQYIDRIGASEIILNSGAVIPLGRSYKASLSDVL